ncbi:MAG: hypothetical protein LBT76_01125, partial [Tannerella sp.]|nr:hypothetical protein [Tannerella sp.]
YAGSPVTNGIWATPFTWTGATAKNTSVHPGRDGSSVENRYAGPLASRTGCNLTGHRLFLPNSHSSRNDGGVNAQTTAPSLRMA